jgi:hypothetical protein
MLRFLLGCLCLLASALANAEEPVEKDWVDLKNESLRVRLLRSHGGAIGHVSTPEGKSLVNAYDHGRLVQQSYYGDADGSRWAEQPWRYNPVQGGDYLGKPAVVQMLKAEALRATARTTPRHWASGELLEECTMEQQVELRGPIAHLHYRFTYNGTKKHQPRHQETPAVFVDAKYKTLVTYSSDAPWTGDKLARRIPGWPNESVRLSEHWAAYVDDSGYGLGIYVPASDEATCYRYRADGRSDCSYIAPLRTFALEPGLDFEYDAYLTLGTVEEIRSRFKAIHQAAAR